MKQYLNQFFEEFDFSANEREFLMNIFDRISEDDESLNALNRAIDMYNKTRFCDYAEITRLSSIPANRLYFHEYSTELLFLICLTKKAREYYKEMGVSEQIYHDSMLDLKYKMIECELV